MPLPTTPPPALSAMLPSGAWVRGAPYAIAPKAGAPKITPSLKFTPWPRYAPDGKTILYAGSTSRLGTETSTGVVLPETRAYRSAFSPDSKKLVVADEDGALRLFAVPSGALLRKLPNAFKQYGLLGSGKYAYIKEVGFPDAQTILFHDGCRLKKLDPAGGDPVNVSPTDHCGHVRVSNDGKRWVIFEEDTKSYGVGLWYTRAWSIDAATGKETLFLDQKAAGPFGDVQISPLGDRVCYVRPDRKVGCASTDPAPTGPSAEVVSDGPIDRLVVFDATGTRALYAEKSSGAATKGLHLVDFAARTLRKVADVANATSSYHFLGSTRIVVEGYDGATAFDLAKGWSMTLFAGGEIEGFAASPNNPKKMLLGKASGPSDDLYWVELPE